MVCGGNILKAIDRLQLIDRPDAVTEVVAVFQDGKMVGIFGTIVAFPKSGAVLGGFLDFSHQKPVDPSDHLCRQIALQFE